jgi:hypothetical protein
MVLICREWNPPATLFSPKCSNKMFPAEGQNLCPVCVDPMPSQIGSCSICIAPPPKIYTVSLTIAPVQLISYYPWLPEYADLGLVEDPAGFTAALVNNGEWSNPGNCGYSASYNLIETAPCQYESEETELYVASFIAASGTFNTSPAYDITCLSSLPGGSSFRRKRVVMYLEGDGNRVAYRVLVRYMTHHLGPTPMLNPTRTKQIGRYMIAPNRDCHQPYSFSQPGPIRTTGGQQDAAIMSVSISPFGR